MDAHTIQTPREMNLEHSEADRKGGNKRRKGTQETHKQETFTMKRLEWIRTKLERLCYYKDPVTLLKWTYL